MSAYYGWPGVVLVWGLAAGVALWASGVDNALQLYLSLHYHAEMNAAMRVLGEMGKGSFQASVCLLVGLFAAAERVAARAGWVAALNLIPRWVAGVFEQFWLLLTGRMVWTRRWRELTYGARVWLLTVPVFLVAGVYGIVLKTLVGRPRPKEVLWNGMDGYATHPFMLDAGVWSFPSGHAVSTFAIATLLAMAFPRWRIVVWAAAAVLACSRFLALTPHFLGDVVAGAALGAAVAMAAGAALRIGGKHGA